MVRARAMHYIAMVRARAMHYIAVVRARAMHYIAVEYDPPPPRCFLWRTTGAGGVGRGHLLLCCQYRLSGAALLLMHADETQLPHLLKAPTRCSELLAPALHRDLHTIL